MDALAKRLVFRKLAAPHKAAVLDFLDRADTDPVDSDSAAVNWRLPYLVALILDTPYFWVR